MDRVLRRMTTDDLDELLCIQCEGAVAALGHIFPQGTHPFPTESIRARWIEEIASPDTDCFIVVGSSGEIAGFAATRADEFLHFGIAMHLWGSGLANTAHDDVLDHLSSQGRHRAWLRVFEHNGRARRFYERHGWTATEERSTTPFAPHPELIKYVIDLSPTL